ncbi:pleckstrin homology domain-containing family G member 4B-like isoform X2 [Halichoeres trimaculatus]|uniref:pleckstrin homology domain-containing family G member 4B-like isoform X2 n=1 Tax=Halichoeres trimaculatus TaxID=147232 RepID=UPI003D9EA7DD
MNLDSLEDSIQNLLSVLYPPFEATAPTLLSQLFQVIESRYQGDALRCLLDFLVPAKHILDTVQQAACAPYPDALFLYEGWPLCLRDQVVVHLAPISPLQLQPGDFYLQVAPFCDQSARIVVCSLLEEEELIIEVVEETPIPETSYPCIFSCDWLEEINRGRHGTPLSQCLLATERGVVRLPWEQVALPNLVDVPLCAGSSMASVPPARPLLASLLPLQAPLPQTDSSPSNLSLPVSPLKESAPKDYPVTIKNPISTSSSHPSAFSVETRICPAKHGIAVSLCLVDSRTASSSRLVKVQATGSEPKTTGVTHSWDSCSTESGPNTATKACTTLGLCSPVAVDDDKCKGDIEQDKNTETNSRWSAGQVPAEGEYIDILQATMLFSRAQTVKEEKEKFEMQMQSNVKIKPHMQRYPQKCTQMQPQAPMLTFRSTQRQPSAQMSSETQTQAHLKFPAETQLQKLQSPCRSEAAAPTRLVTSTEERTPFAPHHSQSWSHHPLPNTQDTSQCIRTVRFSEKPCTPCMRRRQGGKGSRAQELRCRYRDSYQAAIQNPVTFGQKKDKDNISAVVEEDGEFSQCDDRLKLQDTNMRDPWCNVQGKWFDPGIQHQFASSASGGICEESGEKNTAPCWKAGDTTTLPCINYRETNVLKTGTMPEKKSERIAVPFSRFPSDNVNGSNLALGTSFNTTRALSSSNVPQQSDVITAEHQMLPSGTSHGSDTKMNLKPHKRHQSRNESMGADPSVLKSPSAPATRPESMSDGRCSSLSTAVVDTSEKCELVIVEGQNCRRREAKDFCSELPQLHVVKCKHSTAFRLVSPKVNRKNKVSADGAQQGFMTTTNDPQITNLSQTHKQLETETSNISQPVSARPRPDHLHLGSPDPKAHPLYVGVASLTGGRDRTGRAIVELYGNHQGWKSAVTSQELFKMLLYFHSITRREIREAGMTLIFDARRTNPQPQLYKALMTLQEQTHHAIHSFVLLINKDVSPRPEHCPGIQTEMVTSVKALFKHVEVTQLSIHLDGTLPHSTCDWMELHQKLFPFVSDLHEASSLLLRAISKQEEPHRTDSVQTVQQCIMDQRTLMQDVLEDSRLVSLQREGGAMLARLRKESDLKYPDCEDLSDAVDSVTSLYNLVEEEAHVLVQRSNLSLEHLKYLLQLREMEGHFLQMQQWFNVEGEQHLLDAASVEESGDRMEQILNSFTGFLIEANDRRQHAMTLVSEAERLQQCGSSYPETEVFRTLVCTFKSSLEDFLCRAEACGRELQTMVNVCDFCEQATALANECIEFLDRSPSRNHSKKGHVETSTHISQTDDQPVHQQNPESGPVSESLCPPHAYAAHCSGPTGVNIFLPDDDSSALQALHDRFLQFDPERFQEVKVQAGSLQGSKGMQVWNVAWLKCQEARQQLQERMQDVAEAFQQTNPDSQCEHYVDVVSTNAQTLPPGGQSLVVQTTPGPRHPLWEGIITGSVDLGKRRPIISSSSANSTPLACCNIKPEDSSDAGNSQGSKVTPQSPKRSVRKTERDARRRQASRARSERDAAALSQSHTVGCQWFPWGRGLRVRSVSQDSCTTRGPTAESSSAPEHQVRSPTSCSHHGQPSCRILQEAQKFQISRHGSFCSEDSCMSGQATAGADGTVCCKHSSLPVGRYEGMFNLSSPHESASNALRLQRVLEELVLTEREYVRSLGYILTHYHPLLDRPDIPQDLRGKRGVIFGNLEKLYDFHSHYFLPELEACQREPAMVARCFLRHCDSFGLYALYSKNKPQSDALILHHRHDIFKKKQQELGDMMDLSSYLLRPIQRISKYSLLLQDMLALAGSYRPKDIIQDTLHTSVSAQNICSLGAYVPDLTSGERERAKAEIQGAVDLVRFQMRHGNDLLTMDAIQECDVNLKEQGQLVRQDEFTIFFKKKKCVRRVFLFEELILFSKTKKTDIGNDVYVYKQSFKTSDIGMTHNSSVSGLCFEIWFRRRKIEDTYTLRASSMEVKKAWTTDLERILWDQATHNRELRLQERVFMGMGRKPFMDIQPSDAAICDRAVSCALPGKRA